MLLSGKFVVFPFIYAQDCSPRNLIIHNGPWLGETMPPFPKNTNILSEKVSWTSCFIMNK